MGKIFADRVMETSTSTGTGAFVMGGAVTGYADLAAVSPAIGDTFGYVIYDVDADGNPTGQWETGEATITDDAPYTFTRELYDANPYPAGATVDFAAGTKHVALTVPAAELGALVVGGTPVQRMWGVLASATASAFVAGGAGMTVSSTVGATRWDITFDTAFASANDYAVVFGGVDDGAAYGTIPMLASRSTTGFQIVAHKNDPASEATISKLSFEVISTRTQTLGGGGATSAEDVAFAPAGSIAATDVQAAIEEVATEYAAAIAAIPKPTECIIVALGDETTAITVGTAKVTIRMPYAFTLTAVKASLTTASSSGTPTVDINEGGASILSTKLTIDASELTSATAATAAVISDTALAADAEITFDIDTAGTGAKGLKVYLIGHQ